MKILSHRGYWRAPIEKNSMRAFLRSLQLGYGLETDIRDCAGRIVVSHEMPTGEEIVLDELLAVYQSVDRPLALNIKADGLARSLKGLLGSYDIKEWFVFDMSTPDMRIYLNERMPVFARVSEVERVPPWIEEVAGIWFDSFYGGNYVVDRILEFLHTGRKVCIVSPELHNRVHQDVWRILKPLSDEPGLMICTDYPERAKEYFMRDGGDDKGNNL